MYYSYFWYTLLFYLLPISYSELILRYSQWTGQSPTSKGEIDKEDTRWQCIEGPTRRLLLNNKILPTKRYYYVFSTDGLIFFLLSCRMVRTSLSYTFTDLLTSVPINPTFFSLFGLFPFFLFIPVVSKKYLDWRRTGGQ